MGGTRRADNPAGLSCTGVAAHPAELMANRLSRCDNWVLYFISSVLTDFFVADEKSAAGTAFLRWFDRTFENLL